MPSGSLIHVSIEARAPPRRLLSPPTSRWAQTCRRLTTCQLVTLSSHRDSSCHFVNPIGKEPSSLIRVPVGSPPTSPVRPSWGKLLLLLLTWTNIHVKFSCDLIVLPIPSAKRPGYDGDNAVELEHDPNPLGNQPSSEFRPTASLTQE
jgi:hypothetical protein